MKMMHYQACDRIFGTVVRPRAAVLHAALDRSWMSNYRIVGGLAVFLHVTSSDPAGRAANAEMLTLRLTATTSKRSRRNCQSMALDFRYADGGVDCSSTQQPKARSAVHLLFIRRKSTARITWSQFLLLHRQLLRKTASCSRPWPISFA